MYVELNFHDLSVFRYVSHGHRKFQLFPALVCKKSLLKESLQADNPKRELNASDVLGHQDSLRRLHWSLSNDNRSLRLLKPKKAAVKRTAVQLELA